MRVLFRCTTKFGFTANSQMTCLSNRLYFCGNWFNGGEGEMTNGRKKVFNGELKFSRFGVITTRMEIGVH